jgi:hypothetical protein
MAASPLALQSNTKSIQAGSPRVTRSAWRNWIWGIPEDGRPDIISLYRYCDRQRVKHFKEVEDTEKLAEEFLNVRAQSPRIVTVGEDTV